MPKDKKKGNPGSPYAIYKDMADDAAALKIFDVISSEANLSERKISLKTGLAAGLVHAFMRRVISKGWVRVKQVSAKRWLYFITPEGIVEKSNLVMNALLRMMHTYRMAQTSIQESLDHLKAGGNKYFVVAGANELAEIAVINILSAGDACHLTGIVSDAPENRKVAGVAVSGLQEFGRMRYDKLLVCDAFFHDALLRNAVDVPKGSIVNLADVVARGMNRQLTHPSR